MNYNFDKLCTLKNEDLFIKMELEYYSGQLENKKIELLYLKDHCNDDRGYQLFSKICKVSKKKTKLIRTLNSSLLKENICCLNEDKQKVEYESYNLMSKKETLWEMFQLAILKIKSFIIFFFVYIAIYLSITFVVINFF